ITAWMQFGADSLASNGAVRQLANATQYWSAADFGFSSASSSNIARAFFRAARSAWSYAVCKARLAATTAAGSDVAGFSGAGSAARAAVASASTPNTASAWKRNFMVVLLGGARGCAPL